ncbi:peptidoglycan editing factor PgeF [Marinobacter sp. 1_MG-2023]|uniref:peptidoglycan editing factor PgeF n=1 Tax=Marinobacter sp. 1_MG-2023 TaxID=3062627 RepID=UPI0026E27F7B|nr:peptidoglycan editing factor PgeF [Marinobacter sp. 1_MG-2023]MDO6825148.1 peptidoglycan editing factor PgeF [Marinobacter sp. 1_MG-2023]
MSSDAVSVPVLIRPDWSAPANIRAVCTTRAGGVSEPPWSSMNLGDHVGDVPEHVRENRIRLAGACNLPADAFGWLSQVHGTEVVCLPAGVAATIPEADASFTRTVGRACTILTADCLPVILCDQNGTTVAAAHAGWRSLCGGVLENLVAKMEVPADTLMAWLGPAIGPKAFEVGPEVKAAFVSQAPGSEVAFSAVGARGGRYMADIYQIARKRLEALGVKNISGGNFCTVSDSQRFYSYRRDGQTGRMATAIWKI